MINPASVGVLGIGYGALHTALEGLVATGSLGTAGLITVPVVERYPLVGSASADLTAPNFAVGSTAKTSAKFFSAALIATDPTAVTLTIVAGGTSLVLTYGVDAALVRAGTGEYEYVHTAAVRGPHYFVWSGTGDVLASGTARMDVRAN